MHSRKQQQQHPAAADRSDAQEANEAAAASGPYRFLWFIRCINCFLELVEILRARSVITHCCHAAVLLLCPGLWV